MDPLIIEAAINGETPKSRNPNVPREPQEIAADALACFDAGAAIIHSHIESLKLTGEACALRYLEGYRAILAKRPDAILYPTGTSAATIEQRCSHLPILARAGALRMGNVDPGSTNFGSVAGGLPERASIYANPYSDIEYRFAQLVELELGAAISVYEPNFLRSAVIWQRAGRLPSGALLKFYMAGERSFFDGRPGYQTWGLPATPAGLAAYVEMARESGLPWSVAVLGGDVAASGLAKLAIEQGGHLRVGLEDYAGERQPKNAELVAEVVAIAKQSGRKVATPAEAAGVLGLPRA
jgi:uncharacterized protein (DUF849 family)